MPRGIEATGTIHATGFSGPLCGVTTDGCTIDRDKVTCPTCLSLLSEINNRDTGPDSPSIVSDGPPVTPESKINDLVAFTVDKIDYSRFTDRARKIMVIADKEAKRYNHEYLGTEHVLLGVIKEGSGVACSALSCMHISLPKVRSKVESIIAPGPGGESTIVGKVPHTPRTTTALKLAVDEAKLLGNNYVGTEHILLGLLRENQGVAATVLKSFGCTIDGLRATAKSLTSEPDFVGETIASDPLVVPESKIPSDDPTIHLRSGDSSLCGLRDCWGAVDKKHANCPQCLKISAIAESREFKVGDVVLMNGQDQEMTVMRILGDKEQIGTSAVASRSLLEVCWLSRDRIMQLGFYPKEVFHFPGERQ